MQVLCSNIDDESNNKFIKNKMKNCHHKPQNYPYCMCHNNNKSHKYNKDNLKKNNFVRHKQKTQEIKYNEQEINKNELLEIKNLQKIITLHKLQNQEQKERDLDNLNKLINKKKPLKQNNKSYLTYIREKSRDCWKYLICKPIKRRRQKMLIMRI
jgi:hypothetical protein